MNLEDLRPPSLAQPSPGRIDPFRAEGFEQTPMEQIDEDWIQGIAEHALREGYLDLEIGFPHGPWGDQEGAAQILERLHEVRPPFQGARVQPMTMTDAEAPHERFFRDTDLEFRDAPGWMPRPGELIGPREQSSTEEIYRMLDNLEGARDSIGTTGPITRATPPAGPPRRLRGR